VGQLGIIFRFNNTKIIRITLNFNSEWFFLTNQCKQTLQLTVSHNSLKSGTNLMPVTLSRHLWPTVVDWEYYGTWAWVQYYFDKNITIITLLDINDSSVYYSYCVRMTWYRYPAYNLLLCIEFFSLEFNLVSI